jgi:Uma2 family endonuclease
VHLSEHDVLEPDIVVVLREHRERIRDDGICGPPDLVVEVISPGSARTDRVRKAAAYAAFGVPEYWLVDPREQTILVQELRSGRYHPVTSDDGLVRSVVLAGLTIDPRDVFALPDWMTEE